MTATIEAPEISTVADLAQHYAESVRRDMPDAYLFNLACGKSSVEGFKGVDLYADTDVRHDLINGSWDFVPDNSVGMFYCLLPGSKVTTPRGEVAIEEIAAGDVVLGGTGWTTVIKPLSRYYDGVAHRITTSHGVVEVTEDHPIATPSGWLKASDLRYGDSVYCTTKIQPPDRVDCLNVLFGIGGRALPTTLNATPTVFDRRSATAKGRDDIGLLGLTDKEWAHQSKQGNSRTVAAHEAKVRALPIRQRRFAEIGVKRYSGGANQVACLIEDNLVSVCDADLYEEHRLLRNIDADSALAVNDSGQPTFLAIGQVTSIESFHFFGHVYNLNTSDNSFVSSNVLTHNCSHFFEHVADQNAFMMKAWRKLRNGGLFLLITPYGWSPRAWQDPDHKRPIFRETYAYFNKAWREKNQLEHYEGAMDFDIVDVWPVWNKKYAARAEAAVRNNPEIAETFLSTIGAVDDLIVLLRKRASEVE